MEILLQLQQIFPKDIATTIFYPGFGKVRNSYVLVLKSRSPSLLNFLSKSYQSGSREDLSAFIQQKLDQYYDEELSKPLAGPGHRLG
jgi:hypothetical protein